MRGRLGWGLSALGSAGLGLSTLDRALPSFIETLVQTTPFALGAASLGPRLSDSPAPIASSGVHDALAGPVPLLATALLLVVVFSIRALRSGGWRELAFHVATGFVGGVVTSWVYTVCPPGEAVRWLTLVIVAAVAASIPWLLPRDSVALMRLRWSASETRGPLRWSLLRALVACRRIAEHDLHQGPQASRLRRVVEAFSHFARLARQLEPSDPICRRLGGAARALQAASGSEVKEHELPQRLRAIERQLF